MVPIVPYLALLATPYASSPPASHPLELRPDTLGSPPGTLETQRRKSQKRKVLAILTTHPGSILHDQGREEEAEMGLRRLRCFKGTFQYGFQACILQLLCCFHLLPWPWSFSVPIHLPYMQGQGSGIQC